MITDAWLHRYAMMTARLPWVLVASVVLTRLLRYAGLPDLLVLAADMVLLWVAVDWIDVAIDLAILGRSKP
jgi:hypothetical protein